MWEQGRSVGIDKTDVRAVIFRVGVVNITAIKTDEQRKVGKILVNMMVGLALIESLCIYALVICLILIYANPGSAQVAKLLGLS